MFKRRKKRKETGDISISRRVRTPPPASNKIYWKNQILNLVISSYITITFKKIKNLKKICYLRIRICLRWASAIAWAFFSSDSRAWILWARDAARAWSSRTASGNFIGDLVLFENTFFMFLIIPVMLLMLDFSRIFSSISIHSFPLVVNNGRKLHGYFSRIKQRKNKD